VKQKFRWRSPAIGTIDYRRFLIASSSSVYLSIELDGRSRLESSRDVNAHPEKYIAAQWRFISAKGYPDYPPGYADASGKKRCPLCKIKPQAAWCASLMNDNKILIQRLALIQKQLQDAKNTLSQKLKVAESSASAQLKKKLKKAKGERDRLQGKSDMLDNDEKVATAFQGEKKKKSLKFDKSTGEAGEAREKNIEIIEVERFGMPCPDPSLHIELKMQWEYLSVDNVWKRFDAEVATHLEDCIDDKVEMTSWTIKKSKYSFNIPKRVATDTKKSITYKVRRRQPRLSHVVLMPGAIGAGDKAIKGSDLSLGAPRNGVQWYETMLAGKYNVSNAYKEPPGRKKHMSEEDLSEYWGISTPIDEGEAKMKELEKKLASVRKEHKEIMKNAEKRAEEHATIKDKIAELQVFAM